MASRPGGRPSTGAPKREAARRAIDEPDAVGDAGERDEVQAGCFSIKTRRPWLVGMFIAALFASLGLTSMVRLVGMPRVAPPRAMPPQSLEPPQSSPTLVQSAPGGVIKPPVDHPKVARIIRQADPSDPHLSDRLPSDAPRSAKPLDVRVMLQCLDPEGKVADCPAVGKMLVARAKGSDVVERAAPVGNDCVVSFSFPLSAEDEIEFTLNGVDSRCRLQETQTYRPFQLLRNEPTPIALGRECWCPALNEDQPQCSQPCPGYK